MWYTCGDGRECFMEEGSSTNVAYIIIHESGSLFRSLGEWCQTRSRIMQTNKKTE